MLAHVMASSGALGGTLPISRRLNARPKLISPAKSPRFDDNIIDLTKPYNDVYDLWGQQLRLSERISREMQDMQRQMDKELERVQQRIEADTSGAWQQRSSQGNGVTRFSREYRNEGGHTRSYFSESVTIWGPTPTTMNSLQTAPPGVGSAGLLTISILAGVWVAVTHRFAQVYERTPYAERRRWVMLLTWPLLVVVSPAFRQTFFDVMRGGRGRREEERRDGSEGDGDTMKSG